MIPENLKKLRAVLGLTHPQMGTLAGVTGRSWQDYEAGIKTPGGKVFEALAKAHINTNWIFTGQGPTHLNHTGEAAGFVGQHPGFYGYIYGLALRKISESPSFRGKSLEDLGTYAAFVFDVTPLEVSYPEQLQRIDVAVRWLARVIYEDDAAHADVTRDDQKRILDLVAQLAAVEVQEHNLECNFHDQFHREDVHLELDPRLDPEEFRKSDISATRHILVTGGWVVFDPAQPNRGFLESVKDPKDCIEFLETLLGAAERELREKIDRLIELNIEVRPEHLQRNLPHERLAKKGELEEVEEVARASEKLLMDQVRALQEAGEKQHQPIATGTGSGSGRRVRPKRPRT